MDCLQNEDPSEEERQHLERCWYFERKGVIVANPVVFGGSVVILWTFVIACSVSPDYMGRAMNEVAFGWIPEVFTWLYIVSQDIWVLVLLWAMWKYGDLVLGKDGEEPEYSLATWFSMLFCCGVATGLFYYAVAEPMWHYKGWGKPWWHSVGQEYGSEDGDATVAIVVTLYHWGVHGWIPYTTMGAVLAIMSYRRGFPMTIRYCLYPLIGDKVYGWMGDLVDGLSIITSIAGVCTSLGLGAMQINTGMQRINHGFWQGVNYNIPTDPKWAAPKCGGQGQVCAEGQEPYGIQETVGTQIMIIIVITIMATISVVLGLGRGIKFLSQLVFAIACFLMLVVLFSGETWFILDLIVQATGYYIWYLLRIGFHCDAFQRLGAAALGLGGTDGGGGSGWLVSWTIFYWGWWISWGPFVGTFIAKISKGRTLRMFIGGTLIVPTLYCVIWFGIWGGEGIRMQRRADKGNLCTHAYKGDRNLCSLPADADSKSASLAASCVSYSHAYNDSYKKANTVGWTPSCVLDSSYHGGYGRCQENAFSHYTGVADRCVAHTSWVTEPCGGAADPTSSTSFSVDVMTALVKESSRVDVKSGDDMLVKGNIVKITDGTNFEYQTVASADGGTLTLDGKLKNNYANTAKVEKKWPVTGLCEAEIKKEMVVGEGKAYNMYPPEQQRSCFYPLQANVVCLYNQATTDILFDQVSSYSPRPFATLMSMLTLITLTFYFVTSSDSGSLVVDFISGGGHPDPPVFQRIFWSFTEGATAIALLYSGVNAKNSNGALRALQSASIVAGLPYTIILFWCSQSLANLVQEESYDEKNGIGLNPARKPFRIFILNGELCPRHFLNAVAPGLVMGRCVGEEGQWPFEFGDKVMTGRIWTGIFSALYYLSIVIVLFGLTLAEEWNWFVTGVALYIGFGTLLGLVRNGVRIRYKIEHGDLMTDFVCGIVLPMFTLSQIEREMESGTPPTSEEFELKQHNPEIPLAPEEIVDA